MESARVNTEENFRFPFDKALESKFMIRMDQNGTIFERFTSESAFKAALSNHLLKRVFNAAKDETA